jgi:hypothetical protein
MPKVEIMLDRPRWMTATLTVARRFKEEQGIFVWELDEVWTLEQVLTFMWLSLLSDDPELTLEDVEEQLSYLDMGYYVEKIKELLAKTGPRLPGEESPKAMEPLETSTGTPSGPSEGTTSD